LAPQAPYAARLAELGIALSDIEARSSRISSLRGLTFVAALGLGALRTFRPMPFVVTLLAVVAAIAFVALVITHAALVTRGAEIEQRVKILRRGEQRIARDFSGFPDKGERFLVPGHAYARDLDIFGSASLFQLVCAAETGPGEEIVARWLSAPAGADEVRARQAAVKELAAEPRFREDLATAGADSGTRGHGAEPFMAWAEATKTPSQGLLWLGRGLVPITMAALIVPHLVGLEGWLTSAWAFPLAAQLAVLLVLRPKLEPLLKPASSSEAPFGRWSALFRLVEGTSFQAPRLAELKAKVTGASRELAKLQTILGYAEVRASGIAAVLANVFLLWDVFCAAALLNWRARSGRSVRGWIEAVAEIDALAGLATFSAEHPAYAFPEVSRGELSFVAEGLGHPLLPTARRKDNDVAIDRPGTALMVTGSNMSGKSTLLRAIGVNAVLAFAGAPVCARRLSLAECAVHTSMRIDDSLEQGVSHFYAELARLKAVVDAVNAGERVLFLLDEVLHGTNSRERNIGAKAVVVHLLEKGAIGAVSSHDLGLASLEEETAGRVRNVHFQELVQGSTMTFDYELKPGVVTSSNALRLMKLIGIGVALPEE
jgi:hypothetical protein